MATEQRLSIDRVGTMNEEDIRELRGCFRGELLRPDDDGYDGARKVWNGSIDKYPALIARCTGAADVVAAVRFARDRDLSVAVRGGGHNVAGNATRDGGIVIDLSPMKGMRVDPAARTARAQPGLTWGDFHHEAQTFSLATTGGIVSTTGIAGFTLGGGIGWLMRKYGFACDNLISADVVTADGRFMTASATENEDLFWGLRGGGGNFGIVTSFKLRLHPVGPIVMAGVIFHPAEKAAELLRFYRDYIRSLPDELTTTVIARKAPPAPFLPPEVHGKRVVAVAGCYAGPIEEGEEVLGPLKAFGSPIVDLMAPRPYVEFERMFDGSWRPGFQNYWKAEYIDAYGDEAIDVLTGHLASISSPMSDFKISHMGGAVARVAEDATAFGHRSAPFALNINARWSDPNESEKHIAWTRSFWEAMQPFSTGGVYVNFLGNEGEDRVRAAYGEAKYERLVALKNKYDPTNFFRLNQNVRPTAVP